MRDLKPGNLARVNARTGLHQQLLFWVSARSRSTGLIEKLGFWTGDQDRDFVIDGETRTYIGAGTIVGIPPMTFETGLKVRTTRMRLSPLDPAVITAVRQYDVRLAPYEVHIASFDPVTHQLDDEPERRSKGLVSSLNIKRAEKGGTSTCELGLMSAAYNLTRTLAIKKSDATLRARTPTDGLRKYTDVSGTVETVWGEIRASAPSGAAAPATPSGPVRESTNR